MRYKFNAQQINLIHKSLLESLDDRRQMRRHTLAEIARAEKFNGSLFRFKINALTKKVERLEKEIEDIFDLIAYLDS